MISLRARVSEVGVGLRRRQRSALAGAALGWAQGNGLFFAFLIMGTLFALQSDRFLTSSNVKVILLQVSVVGIIAVPGAMLVLSGYVDLSIGGVAVMASIIFGELAGPLPVWAAFTCALGIGAVWGLFNGLVIMYLDFSPIIVTLGGLAAARGIAEVISRGYTEIGFGESFVYLGNGEPGGLPTPVWLFIGAFLIGGYIWYQMRYGRHMTAIGADRTAAYSLGVAVRRIPFIAYIASGFAAALGGLIVTSQLDSSSISIGVGLELEVLTAILLGGVSFVGGRGSLFGVLIGVLFIGTLSNGLIVIGINPFWEDFAVGAALVFAAGLDAFYRRLERIPVGEAEPAVPAGVDTRSTT